MTFFKSLVTRFHGLITLLMINKILSIKHLNQDCVLGDKLISRWPGSSNLQLLVNRLLAKF